MTKSQRAFVLLCSIGVLVGAAVWFAKDRSLEPAVVFLAGLASLTTIYWPSFARYKRRRKTGRVTFDYSLNNGVFEIGSDELRFETQWSKASDVSIYIYRDRPSVEGIALAPGASRIRDIRDASRYEMSSRTVCPREGEVVILRNNFGNYAVIRVLDVQDRTRSDAKDELTFEYAINPAGGTDFA
ncbi:MAG: hypothetical protein ACE5JQ_01935 [Candidatus Methylomirabilales bacterium]